MVQSVILSVINKPHMLSIVNLNVVMLSVIMLNVVVPSTLHVNVLVWHFIMIFTLKLPIIVTTMLTPYKTFCESCRCKTNWWISASGLWQLILNSFTFCPFSFLLRKFCVAKWNSYVLILLPQPELEPEPERDRPLVAISASLLKF